MNRDFKGIWIPREIWLMENLSAQEKCLWAEIHSLFDREKGGCYASNEYLMDFVGVKERRLQEMMASLKEKGLIIQVSFNGRERVIKAVLPPEDFGACGAEVQESAPLGCGKVHLSDAESCTPLIYREKRIDKRIDNTSLKVSEKPEADASMPAKAGEKKKKIFPEEWSSEVLEVGQSIVEAMKEVKPDCKEPNPHKMLKSIDSLIRLDRREPAKILSVFRWAVNDTDFWSAHMFKPDPAAYLRLKFDSLEKKMEAKPKEKPRTFATYSNSEKLKAMAEETEKEMEFWRED